MAIYVEKCGTCPLRSHDTIEDKNGMKVYKCTNDQNVSSPEILIELDRLEYVDSECPLYECGVVIKL